MFFISRPPWAYALVAFAAFFYILSQPASAQGQTAAEVDAEIAASRVQPRGFAAASAPAGAWRFVSRRWTGGYFSDLLVTYPKTCRNWFATSEDALSCLRANGSWPLGWFTKDVGNNGVYNGFSGFNRSSVLERVYENGGFRLNQFFPSTTISVDASGATQFYGLSNIEYRLVHASNPSDLIVPINPSNGNHHNDGSYIFLSNLKRGDSGSSCLGSSVPDCSSGVGTTYLYSGGLGITLAYFPGETPRDDEDGDCVGKSITLSMSAAEYSSINPQAGTEVHHGACVAIWEKPRGTPDTYTSACLTPMGGQTLCFAKGLRQLSQPEPVVHPEVTQDAPLTIKVGDTAAEQKALKAPETAKNLIGWGGTFGKLIPIASQLPMIGDVVKIASAITPDMWSNWTSFVADGLVKLEVDYKQGQSAQDYYHPGNHTEGGSYLGAFDRDWSKTDYDADKAWNWSKTPAVDADPEKLAVIEQPNGPASGGGDTFVSNVTNNHTTIYPPGVAPPGGNPSAPPDSSVTPPEDGSEGGYEGGNSLYTSKYPDGLAGVWDGFKDEIMQESGIGEFLNAFRMPTGVAIADLCFNFDFDMGKTIDLGTQGFCISENIILIVKALLIISAFIVARRLVFGG